MAVEWLAEKMKQGQLERASELFTQAGKLSVEGKIDEAEIAVKTAQASLGAAREIPIFTQEYLKKLQSVGVDQPPLITEENTDLEESLSRIEPKLAESEAVYFPQKINRLKLGEAKREKKRSSKSGDMFTFPDDKQISNLYKPELKILNVLPASEEEAIAISDLIKAVYPSGSVQDSKHSTHTILTRLRWKLKESGWTIINTRRKGVREGECKYYLKSIPDEKTLEEIEKSRETYTFPDGHTVIIFGHELNTLKALPLVEEDAISIQDIIKIAYPSKDDQPQQPENAARCILARITEKLKDSSWAVLNTNPGSGKRGAKYYLGRTKQVTGNDSVTSIDQEKKQGPEEVEKVEEVKLLSKREIAIIGKSILKNKDLVRIRLLMDDRCEINSLLAQLPEVNGVEKKEIEDLIEKLVTKRNEILKEFRSDEDNLFLLTLIASIKTEDDIRNLLS